MVKSEQYHRKKRVRILESRSLNILKLFITASCWVTTYLIHIRNGYDLLPCCGLSNFISSLSECSIHAVRMRQRKQAAGQLTNGDRSVCRRSRNTCTFPHKALGRDSCTAETNSSLSFHLFRGRKCIRFVKAEGRPTLCSDRVIHSQTRWSAFRYWKAVLGALCHLYLVLLRCLE